MSERPAPEPPDADDFDFDSDPSNSLLEQTKRMLGAEMPRTTKVLVADDRQKLGSDLPAVPTQPELVGTGKTTLSRKKIEANRRNAQRSTGPKTPRGKQWSRRNSTRHGVLTSELLICHGTNEDAAAFEEMLEQFYNDLGPVGEVERALAKRIAICHWRLDRALRFERDAISSKNCEVNRGDPTKARQLTYEELMSLLAEMQASEAKALAEKAEASNSRYHSSPLQRREDLLRFWWSNGRSFEASVESMLIEFLPHILGGEAAQPMIATIQAASASRLGDIPQSPLKEDQDRKSWMAEPLALPSGDEMNCLLRYETAILRQLAFCMNQLERLQRARKGEHVLAPVNVQVSSEG